MELRMCKKCGIEKELTTENFEQVTPYKDMQYFRHVCISCGREARNRRKRERLKRYRQIHPLNCPPPDIEKDGEIFRTCLGCNAIKELTANFRAQPSVSGRIVRRHKCKQCLHKQHTVWGQKNILLIMIQSAKFRAKRDNVPFEISVTDIEIPGQCPVFKHPFVQGTRHSHEWAPTLDRKIPELGYIKNNVEVISHKANRIKTDASLDELKMIVAYLEGRAI